MACFIELEEKGVRAGFDGGVTIPATLSSLGHPRRGLVGSGKCRMSRWSLEATVYIRMDHIVQEMWARERRGGGGGTVCKDDGDRGGPGSSQGNPKVL